MDSLKNYFQLIMLPKYLQHRNFLVLPTALAVFAVNYFNVTLSSVVIVVTNLLLLLDRVLKIYQMLYRSN